MYLAMVVSNFGLVDIDIGWDSLGGYTLGHILVDTIMVLPSILQIPIIYMVVRTNNLLTAIAELDVDIVSYVIEETEEMAVLEEEVRGVFERGANGVRSEIRLRHHRHLPLFAVPLNVLSVATLASASFAF